MAEDKKIETGLDAEKTEDIQEPKIDEIISKKDSEISKIANERDSAKKHSSALEKKLNELSTRVSEYEKAHLSEEERRKKEEEENARKQAEKDNLLKQREIEILKRDYLDEKGIKISAKLLKRVSITEPEDVTAEIDNFLDVFNAAVSEQVQSQVEKIKKEFYSSIPNPGESNVDGSKDNPFLTNNRTEQARIYTDDRALYEKLKAEAARQK